MHKNLFAPIAVGEWIMGDLPNTTRLHSDYIIWNAEI